MLPEVHQNKILQFKIHPVAEMYKKQLQNLRTKTKRKVESYHPAMFRKCRLGCWECH